MTAFKERFYVRRSPVFLSYYVFTASIMHVRTRALIIPSGIDIILIAASVVNAYPDDPQARNGLTTCMDMLQRMSIVWPSAGRAWELLYGSKANPRNSVGSLSTADVVRVQKRTADHFLDDEATLYQVDLHSATQEERSEAVHDRHHAEQPSTLGSSQNFYALCSRWPGEGSINDFDGSLSTSVLPQQYSTGFFDGGVLRGSDTSSAAGVGVNSQQESPVNRRGYPRFWSDYSALSQLGPPFAGSVEYESQQHQQPQSQAYPISGQYSLFGERASPTAVRRTDIMYRIPKVISHHRMSRRPRLHHPCYSSLSLGGTFQRKRKGHVLGLASLHLRRLRVAVLPAGTVRGGRLQARRLDEPVPTC
jgi:hypothetical protein